MLREASTSVTQFSNNYPIFATPSSINNKDSFYIVTKPDKVKNEFISSNCRNHYKSSPTGDAHCRGVRIVLNSTFTAGGLTAPLFVSIYGLSKEEMPNDDCIAIPVPGLTVGFMQDICSSGEGFISFVRGNNELNERSVSKDNRDDTNSLQQDSEANTGLPIERLSKEALQTEKYRRLVYHPFICKIRDICYDYNGPDEECPKELTAVSWFDGCGSQLRPLVTESNMKKERQMKIICCKHSAARTAVEQAADTGAMFKTLKYLLRQIYTPTAGNNSVYHNLE